MLKPFQIWSGFLVLSLSYLSPFFVEIINKYSFYELVQICVICGQLFLKANALDNLAFKSLIFKINRKFTTSLSN